MAVKPYGDNILVELNTLAKGGPTSVIGGKIVAFSDLSPEVPGLAIGTKVIFEAGIGAELKIDGKPHTFLRISDIRGVRDKTDKEEVP